MINFSVFPHLKEKNITIGQLYDPFIQYAVNDSPTGLVYMDAVIEYTMTHHGLSLQKATTLVRHNIDYWCQRFSSEEEQTTKKFYDLGLGFRDLTGIKHQKKLTPMEAFELGKKAAELYKKERE